jgi:hypothetical protein
LAFEKLFHRIDALAHASPAYAGAIRDVLQEMQQHRIKGLFV